MRSFNDAAGIAAAPHTITDLTLRKLLADRIHDWAALRLLALTHLVIAEPGDTEEVIAGALGFSPLTNPLDCLRYGADDFVSPWDWAEEHDSWLELMMTIGNGGYALFLFVSFEAEVASRLRALCRAHVGR